ncbi:MAG: hypothetical protein KF778_08425 [Rhodocyclaceae bacterium]|nr:hypothetical protein [Rhodocyclaceae bacterium]MBX3668412.1 hypothetical protein [Rhodocyclaceae bacterium]
MTTISPRTILALLEEIESDDPVDFGALPVDGHSARSLVAAHLAELRATLVSQRLSGEDREAVLLATASRVILENLQLHVRALYERGEQASVEFDALLARLKA